MTFSYSKKQWSIVGLIILILIAFGGGIYYYHSNKCNLCDFDPINDRATLISLFKNNKYWLTTNDDYNIEHMFDTKSPNDYQPEYVGKLHIKVARIHGDPIGFVAYYKKKFYEGFILFLAIDEKYRGKGYATKLLKYAINALFKDHALVVRLVTRTDNHAAMKVYKRAGMHEIKRTNGFVYFEIRK
jgi:ribosomal protein S18 acetylase RimI-like enzyme